MDHQHTFREILYLWAEGQPIGNMKLLGIPIFIIGRLGKVLQFIGALTIIAEIVGVERLNKFGNSLHNSLTYSKLKNLANSSIMYTKMVFTFRTKQIISNLSMQKIDTLNIAISFIISFCVLPYFATPNFITMYMCLLLFCIVAAFTISPITSSLLVIILSSLGLLFDKIVIKPTAYILENKKLEKRFKIFSVCCLIIGFLLDLFAS